MAFGSAPDISGSIAVPAICESNCSSRLSPVDPNPNGAYPSASGMAKRHGDAGNGKGGSNGLGFPPPPCCTECQQCSGAAGAPSAANGGAPTAGTGSVYLPR